MEMGWLSFWRVKAGKDATPEASYDALHHEKEPAGLDDLPVGDILAAVKQQYPSFDPKAEFVEIDIRDEETAIEPRWNKKRFHFTFYGNAFKQMNRTTGLKTRLGLTCYDAGTEKMYCVEKPPPSFDGKPVEQSLQSALDAEMQRSQEKQKRKK
jgi:hypothetical protein